MSNDSTFDICHWDHLKKSGYYASAAYSGGEFGVIWMNRDCGTDEGQFIAESKLPAAIEAAEELDPRIAGMLRFTQSRIAGLRAAVDPSMAGGRP